MRQSWIPPWPSTTATFQRSVTTSPATKSRQKKRQLAPIWPSCPIVNRRARTSTSSPIDVSSPISTNSASISVPRADRHTLADLGAVLAVERDLLVGGERGNSCRFGPQPLTQLVRQPPGLRSV